MARLCGAVWLRREQTWWRPYRPNDRRRPTTSSGVLRVGSDHSKDLAILLINAGGTAGRLQLRERRRYPQASRRTRFCRTFSGRWSAPPLSDADLLQQTRGLRFGL